MIVRRLALFFALLFGFAMTQVPEFVQQFEQRLGGAIDEIAATVARFDSDSAQQGLTQSGGIDRLRSNGDRFVRQRGEQMQDDVARLARLRETQAEFRSDGPVASLATFVTHYDSRVARGDVRRFQAGRPSVRSEAFVLGALGFLFGGASSILRATRFAAARRAAAVPSARPPPDRCREATTANHFASPIRFEPKVDSPVSALCRYSAWYRLLNALCVTDDRNVRSL